MARAYRILIVLAAIMGADGVMLAAASAHGADASRLASASSMLLFHAVAVLGIVVLAERAIVHRRIGIAAGFGFVIAASLFAGDLTLKQYAGHGLFPMAAPTGGTLLIASWLAVAVAAAWPRTG
jgi:uncharacterized membrane protein YgdD (TMEM256/DUF423 family)